MAELNFKIDSNDVLGEGFEIIEAGEYVAIIKASEIKETKSGTGKYINFQWEIVDGKHKGRVLFSMVHLWNVNSTAVEIAKKTLNTIGFCCGLENVKDTAQLHGKPMLIKVSVKNDETYGPKNEIKNYKPLGAKPVSNPAFAEPPVMGGSKKSPWEY